MSTPRTIAVPHEYRAWQMSIMCRACELPIVIGYSEPVASITQGTLDGAIIAHNSSCEKWKKKGKAA